MLAISLLDMEVLHGWLLPDVEPWKGFLMDPRVPLVGSVAYLVGIFGLEWLFSLLGSPVKSSSAPSTSSTSWLRTKLVVLHNIFLAAVSLLMLLGSLAEVYDQMHNVRRPPSHLIRRGITLAHQEAFFSTTEGRESL